MKPVVERFLKYVSLDTQSVPDAGQVPSTSKQKNLSGLLVQELRELGIANADMDEYGIVYASIPASPGCESVPVVGFIAHLDTSPAVSGKDVRPRVIHAYSGEDIVLNADMGLVLSPREFPELLQYQGDDVIVTDGTTLLGADDKAGIAEIMTMAAELMANPSLKHGPISIAFTPDEEVGGGIEVFDLDRFGASFAYTVDGGALGEIEYENFNAASVRLSIVGKSIHPGYAKGRMINALLVAMDFQSMLPVYENPACTEGYEGFYHLESLQGTVDHAVANYIIRDHDRRLFEEKKEQIGKIVDYLNGKYGAGTLSALVQDSYYNMKEKVQQYPFLIENAKQAMRSIGVEPILVPVRGGTDGAFLSLHGLPCPNLCAGGHNFHGRYEYIPIQSLEKIAALLVELAQTFVSESQTV